MVASLVLAALLLAATPQRAHGIDLADPHAALEFAQGQDEESLVSGTLGATVVERDARLVVGRVGRGTPAARSGLRPGDVVLELDGEAITSPHEFYRRVLDTPPGRTVELTIERSGEAKRLEMRVRPIDTTPRA